MTHKQITKKTLYQIASIYKIKKRSYMNKAELLINIRRTYLIKKYFYMWKETNRGVSCCDCDYHLTMSQFEYGYGRIMFSMGYGIRGGEYRCGVCDDRADNSGEFPCEDFDY